MKWILGAGKDITVDENQLRARTKYIRSVTEADVSNWQPIQVYNCQFLYCASNDSVDGIFLTAHYGDIRILSTLPQVYENSIIIVNSCIWVKSFHKMLLNRLYKRNPNLELYFAKQELCIDTELNLRQTTLLLNVGQFGFQSSSSERELFMNRRKGLEEAIRQSFERVSPILLAGE